MNAVKRKRLEEKGWKFGDVKEFVGLSQKEARHIETKLALSKKLEIVSQKEGLT
jgi:hypothetical protein